MRITASLVSILLSLGVMSLGLAGTAAAKTIVLDGENLDWSTRLPQFGNSGVIARDAAQTGEYIFFDATDDERTDLPETNAEDIRELHVTGDATNLYILA